MTDSYKRLMGDKHIDPLVREILFRQANQIRALENNIEHLKRHIDLLNGRIDTLNQK